MAIDYTKLLDGNSLKAIRSYIISNYQPLHANLTALSKLATNVTGLIKMTNGVASFDSTTYAPLASPSFTGTPTLPTTTKIGTLTSTGFVKYTNGVLSVDTNSYKTDYRYRPIYVAGVQKLSNTNSTGLDFINPSSGYNVVFTWDTASYGIKANVDLSGYQPLDADLTAIAGLSGTSGFLKKTAANTWSLDINSYSLSNHTHSISLTADTGTSSITLASGSKYKLTAGGNSVIFTMPVVSAFPEQTTANKVLLSTTTSGSVVWSSWSTAGFLKTNSSGVVSVDTSSYQPLDSDLTAIAGLSGTSGLLKKTAANKWSLDTTSYIPTSQKGVANGIASLDSNGKVPTSQLPDSVVGSMEYRGSFDATKGLSLVGLEKGWYYICSTAGPNNPDGTTGPSDGYSVGDWAVYNGSITGWSKIDNDGKVTSVNNKVGAVTLTYSDVGALASSTKYAKSLSVSGRTVTLKDQDGTTLSTITTQDTTYESKTAVLGGTALSLVTTGEKANWNRKQNALVSGSNIKTINGESILGSGNIAFPAEKVFVAEYGVTTLSEIQQAYQDGLIILMKGKDSANIINFLYLSQAYPKPFDNNQRFSFIGYQNNGGYYVETSISSSGWTNLLYTNKPSWQSTTRPGDVSLRINQTTNDLCVPSTESYFDGVKHFQQTFSSDSGSISRNLIIRGDNTSGSSSYDSDAMGALTFTTSSPTIYDTSITGPVTLLLAHKNTSSTKDAPVKVYLPSESGTLAIKNCYTEAEALSILNGTAS